MWRTVKLGEVCNVRRGTTITKKNTVAGVVPVIGGGTKPTYFHNEANRDAGCITVSGSGASAGFVNYWDTPIFASDCSTVEIKTDELLQRFVYYFMQSQQQYIYENFRSGAAQPHVYAKDIATLEIPVITPAEQKRIVAKLDTAFAEINKAIKLNEQKKENAADAHAAYMEQVFRASLLEYKQSTLGELCEFHNGKAHEKDISDDGEFYVVNSKFISSDGTVAKYTNKQMFPLVAGDIVMVMSDVPNGKALAKAMQINEDGKYSLNQRICCIRSNHYHPQFLQTVLNRHPHFLKFNNGENQTNLRKNDILECPLPVIPLSEQISLLQPIQLFKEETHKLSKIYNEQSRNYDALKSAILTLELQSEAA